MQRNSTLSLFAFGGLLLSSLTGINRSRTHSGFSFNALLIEEFDSCKTRTHASDQVRLNWVNGRGQSVVRVLPMPRHFHKLAPAEICQVPRDRRLRKVEDAHDVANAQLAGG